MAVTSQSENNTIMRRFVRDGLIPRPVAQRSTAPVDNRGERSDRETAHAGPQNVGLEGDIVHSIQAIERVVENFGVLKDNFHFHKDLAGELRSKLEDERAQREAVDREAADLERSLRAERDRASRAETSLKNAEANIKNLEAQLGVLQGQTEQLIKAVTQLVSAEMDARGEDGDSSLRLVS